MKSLIRTYQNMVLLERLFFIPIIGFIIMIAAWIKDINRIEALNIRVLFYGGMLQIFYFEVVGMFFIALA